MRVLDANFLIDYLQGVSDTKAYYEANGAEEQRWVVSAPAHAEALVGVGNHPPGDIERATEALCWGEVYEIDEELSVVAARIGTRSGREARISTVSMRSSRQSGSNWMPRSYRQTVTSRIRRQRPSSLSTSTEVDVL